MSESERETRGIARRDMFKVGAAAVVGGLAMAGAVQGLRGRRARAEDDEGNDAEAVTVELAMGEFYFQVAGDAKNAPVTVEAGKPYKFELKNVGKAVHEIAFGRTAVFKNGAAVDYEEVMTADTVAKIEGQGVEVEALGFEAIELKPGKDTELRITFSEDQRGTWEIGCFIPGHYEAGMKAPFIVT